jgi:3-deoxy-D-manno-octulosonic-acid transferase
MNRCYSIIIRLYYYIILFASPFNKKAKQWITGRKNWESELAKKIEKGENWIWFHCSSLGEFEDCCEIFFKMQKNFPSKKTILTVFSPSAFEVLKQSGLFDVISYLPLDTKANAKAFVDIVKPELVLFSRSELWLNILLEVQERAIPIFLISLKLSTKSNFIKWPFNIIYVHCFRTFNIIFCQNAETQQLLHSYFNISNSLITGNTRFERVNNESQTKATFPDIEKFVSDRVVIVMGSCLPKDERIFLEIYDSLRKLRIKWIIVPHEIEKSIISRKMNSKSIILYSNIKELNKFHDILIIDSVGILKHVYRYANFALIGGGFDKIGIHNIIEPAVHGVQMAFGPNHKNYEEAIQLLNLSGASVYKDSVELIGLIKSKLLNPANLVLRENMKQYVKANTLNNSKIIDSIRTEMNY